MTLRETARQAALDVDDSSARRLMTRPRVKASDRYWTLPSPSALDSMYGVWDGVKRIARTSTKAHARLICRALNREEFRLQHRKG